jgi:rhamnogalacturonan acetylesterase
MNLSRVSRMPALLVCGLLSFWQTAPVAFAAPTPAEDDRPVVDDTKAAPAKPIDRSLPTLFIVGDSTVSSNGAMRGWGQELGAFFDAAKINVVNRAIGGRSSRTYQNEGRWDKVAAELKPGDFVLVQFGHNDVGNIDDPAAKGRPSLHGDGEETREIARPDGTMETVHTFGWYMRKYGADAKAKGARCVYCSMVPHKSWKDGKISRGERDTFVKWTAAAAKATGAAFIDLNEMSAREYERLGPEKVEALFADKGTHSTSAGAQINAQCVLAGLRALRGAPLDRDLSEKGRAVAALPAFVVSGP